MNASLPKQSNNKWFETFDNGELQVGDQNLIVTDKYVIGVNTVGQSLKNASHDLRPAPPNPKFAVSPWMNSTIEPDFNIRPFDDNAECPPGQNNIPEGYSKSM